MGLHLLIQFAFILQVFSKYVQLIHCETIPPIVTVSQGQLQGTIEFSRDNNTFYQFLGIQYSEVVERFQMSHYPKAWEGVKNATNAGSSCPTYYKDRSTGDEFFNGAENCLYLNIYTPQLNLQDNKTLPVMVFFHPGGFERLAGNFFGPKFIMDESTVLVTTNFRLSALGFLSTEDDAAPGNMGLKDQVMALRWIKENIHNFGGDANKVTIFGSSAGAASVTYHLLSKMSEGLFQHGIAESGSALNPWAFSKRPLDNAKKLAEYANCTTETTKALIACLQSKDYRDILRNQRSPFDKWVVDPNYYFVPSAEPTLETESDNFLTEDPYEAFKAGRIVNKVPLLIGVNKEEGLAFFGALIAHDAILAEKMDKRWNLIAPSQFSYDYLPMQLSDITSLRIRNFYLGNKSINVESQYDLAHIYSDRWFIKGVKDTALLYSKHYNSVFNYIFTYDKLQNIDLEYSNITEQLDATHGDELQLLFNLHEVADFPIGSESYNLSRKFVKLWTSFARTGKPTDIWGSDKEWLPVNSDNVFKWHQLDIDSKPVEETFTQRLDFWDTLPL